VIKGEVLPPCKTAPERMNELMTDCWVEDPKRRPTFEELLIKLKSIKKEINLEDEKIEEDPAENAVDSPSHNYSTFPESSKGKKKSKTDEETAYSSLPTSHSPKSPKKDNAYTDFPIEKKSRKNNEDEVEMREFTDSPKVKKSSKKNSKKMTMRD